MIPRTLESRLLDTLDHYPVIALTGARQTGKSTLLKAVLASRGFGYVNLEDPSVREFAAADPKRFLQQSGHRLIIDEIQLVPSLLSWIQATVDESFDPRVGFRRETRFILSGSQNFALLRGIAQSLAGRVALLEMHGVSHPELLHAQLLPDTLDEMLLHGRMPAVWAQQLLPSEYYANYVNTYIERDVRSLSAVQNLGTFQRFLRLVAARTGQLLNVHALAIEAGVNHGTANAWLNILEAGFLIRRVPPYHVNFGKRLVKAPKLYMLDQGLSAWLLDIRTPGQLSSHYLRGALFETWLVAEAFAWNANRRDSAPFYFWRDNVGHEVDLLIERPDGIDLVECKSGHTFQPEWVKSLETVSKHIGKAKRTALVYGGDLSYQYHDVAVIGWRDCGV